MKRLKMFFIGVSLFGLALSGCAGNSQALGALTATGTISADMVSVSPETNEKVLQVNIREGQNVVEGDVLFVQNDELLRAQVDQVSAQVEAARATVQAAEAQLANARVQYELMLQGVRQQDSQQRTAAWQAETSEELGLPGWYYQKEELLAAAQAEERAAEAALEQEKSNLAKVLADASNDDFVAAEKRLAEANQTYETLNAALEQAQAARENVDVEAAAQDQLDAAITELNSARLAYDRMLTSAAADDVQDARAQVAVAQARLDNARSATASLETGDDSLQVKAGEAQVQQAETALAQAKANQSQAEAALRLIELQLERTSVKAPVSGTIIARNIEVGEFASAGSIALTIGNLDQVKLVVYVPEDEYGAIQLNEPVQVSVDSYPGQVFNGTVIAIADQAEFTPRNVSTSEGRTSTVFAVEILIPNTDHALKPGMPADVTFGG